MVFLTLTPVNKSTKFGLKKLFLLFFLLEKKKRKDRHVLHMRFAFHSENLQTKYIIKSTTTTTKKCEGPTNK
jgi:hypothetical protein